MIAGTDCSRLRAGARVLRLGLRTYDAEVCELTIGGEVACRGCVSFAQV